MILDARRSDRMSRANILVPIWVSDKSGEYRTCMQHALIPYITSIYEYFMQYPSGSKSLLRVDASSRSITFAFLPSLNLRSASKDDREKRSATSKRPGHRNGQAAVQYMHITVT
jgi:hypothetical protein